MHRPILTDGLRGVPDGLTSCVIYTGHTEWRLETTRRIKCHAVEAHEVRRSDEDRNVEPPASKEAVSMCRNGTGVHQSRVGRDERDQLAAGVPARRREMPIDRSGEGLRRAWIPAPRDGRASDRHCKYTVGCLVPGAGCEGSWVLGSLG